MEKLVELLREYNMSNQSPYILGDADYYVDGGLYAPQIISKNYGFVKWLVENEKLKWTNKMEMRKIMLGMPEKQDYYIMMLAVTPKPIEFLISILK